MKGSLGIAHRTYIILGLIASAAFTLNGRWIRLDLTQDLGEGTLVRVPGLLAFENHCRETDTSGTAGRSDPHDLDFRFGEVIRLGYGVDAVVVEFGQRIAEQLEPADPFRTGDEGAGVLRCSSGGLSRQHKMGELLEFDVRPGTDQEYLRYERYIWKRGSVCIRFSMF